MTSECLLNQLIEIFSNEFSMQMSTKQNKRTQKRKQKKVRVNTLTHIRYGEYFIGGNDEKNEYELIKIVAISDTHQKHKKLNIPDGDILILSGDYTKKGGIQEALKVNRWLATIRKQYQYKHILLINGNHEGKGDILLNGQYKDILAKHMHNKLIEGKEIISLLQSIYKQQMQKLKKLMTNCTILDDESIIIEGIKFYGTPWCSSFTGKKVNYGLNLQPQHIVNKWRNIPKDVNYLITHDAPQGIMDRIDHPGCSQLRLVLNELPELKVHQFGHVHGCWGYQFITKQSMIQSVESENKNENNLFLSDKFGNNLIKYKASDINNRNDVEKCVLFLNAVNNGVEQPMWINFQIKQLS